MALMDLVTLPLRLGVAATQVTLALGELVAPEGPVRREGGLADQLERVVGEGGTLDQLVALGETLEAIAPRLAELGVVVPDLHASVTTLHETVGPLSDLAGRLPGSRRKALAPSPRSDDALF